MKKFLVLFILLAGLAVLSTGCDSEDASASTKIAPEDVVQSFYEWYLDYPGNVIVDGAHRSSEYLTEAFVQRVDELVASFDKGGYDPFLQAQDIPQRFTVEKAEVAGDKANVLLHQVWNADTEYEFVRDVQVTLKKVDGVWKIDDIAATPADNAVPMRPEVEARGVAQTFYNWYLSYIGDRASGEMRNPLVDGAYRSSEFLTEAFVQQVDELIASFDKGGYDPFLCAQDIPTDVTVNEVTVSGDTASATVNTSFAGHSFQVELQRSDEQWKISNIICR